MQSFFLFYLYDFIYITATCTYPIGLVIRLLFRLEPQIFIVSFELNVSSIALYSTFFSIATISHTDTITQNYTDYTETRNTQKSPTEHNQDYIHTLELIESILHH